MDYGIYKNSLGAALVLMLFFAIYFLVAKTPVKPIFCNYVRSRRIMGVALLVLSANYSVHLFDGLRFYNANAAILMNLVTYFLSYLLFSSAFIALLDRSYITRRRLLTHLACWAVYAALSVCILIFIREGAPLSIALLMMAIWLLTYGIFLSRRIITTYHRAVRLFDDTHSENIEAYIRWMSILTWWAIIYGVSCGVWTFLPEKYVFIWVLSSIPFYIYLYCSYMNYLLFYERVESILENAPQDETEIHMEEIEKQTDGVPAYHATIEKYLAGWMEEHGYTTPGLTIEDLATTLGTNRTYLSAYIKQSFRMSFREWIAFHRIEYAKGLFVSNPKISVAEASETSGFLSLSYFTKIFTEKEGVSPSKWRKAHSNS